MAMSQRKDFVESAEGIAIIEALRLMMDDTSYNTPTSYSANSDDYPNNQMPFVDKHLKYLQAHPKLDARQYVANIKLMSRIK